MASSAGKQEVIDLTMDDCGEIVYKQEDAVIPNDNICVENPPKQEANTGYGDEKIPKNLSPDEIDSTGGDEKNTDGDEEYLPNSDEDEDGYEEDNDDDDEDENIPILNREVVLALPAFKRSTPHSNHQKGPAITQEIFDDEDDVEDDDEKPLKNEENGNDNDENGKALKPVKKEEIFYESDEENVPLMPDPDLIKKEEDPIKEEKIITRGLGKYPMFGIFKEDIIDNQQSHHDQAQYDHDGYPMFGVFKQDINFQDEATPDRKLTRSELRRQRKKWFGAIVYKDYGCMRHTGRVVDCNIETGWFKVMYEDSEYEDMEKKDLMRHLANSNRLADRKHNPKRRKEGEVKTKATTSSSSSKRKKKTAREAKKKEATSYIPLALREKKSDAYYWYSR